MKSGSPESPIWDALRAVRTILERSSCWSDLKLRRKPHPAPRPAQATAQDGRRILCHAALWYNDCFYTVLALNGVAVARHGLKLWQNGATACKILMDTFWDQTITIFD